MLAREVLSRFNSYSTLCLGDTKSALFTESLWYIKNRISSEELNKDEAEELTRDLVVYRRYLTRKDAKDAWVIQKYYIKAMTLQIKVYDELIGQQEVGTN